MKIKFEKPNVPNFIRTTIGMIPLQNLSEEELNEYTDLFRQTLIGNYLKRKDGEEERQVIDIDKRKAIVLYSCQECNGSTLTIEAFKKHDCKDYPEK